MEKFMAKLQSRGHQECNKALRARNRATPRVEQLEDRTMMSASGLDMATLGVHVLPNTLREVQPSELRHAYGIDNIMFGSITGDGTGQTIAIIDAFNDPTIVSDLAAFDSNFGIAAPPSFTVLNQTGGTTLPPNSPRGSWDLEESLDVEYAHTIAPNASIILYEATSPTFTNLDAAVVTAKKHNGVVAVSMSFSGGEFSSEVNLDKKFTDPLKTINYGTVFLASTGDGGAPGGYPAFSHNVTAVGGTSLTIDSSGNWVGESGWAGSGGGTSLFEAEPSYQMGVQSTGKRQMPDIAFDADPSSGVPVLDTYGFGSRFIQVGGTSLSCPCWAGLVAISDQGRMLNGLKPFRITNTDQQFQTALYGAPAADFHDITTGNNGFPAGPGYDLVTGIGSPIANLLVPYLASVHVTAVQDTVSDDGSGAVDAGRVLAGNMASSLGNYFGAFNLNSFAGNQQHDGNAHQVALDQAYALGLL
jgi:subtilase family serine protease